ncbi:MAG: glycoside hydrolase family 127 protein, partial [Eubacteriales bacterium]|nr:glycoside hydrolase family 127 protein [Eubacteriales bacterium]
MMLHHEMLAGLIKRSEIDPLDYGGWESACCQLKGHFLGHYLSACAMAWAYHADAALRGRGEEIVSRLRSCQIENGDGWCFSVPEAYLSWLERGKTVWAPQYTVHKTLMGLLDMAVLADCKQALEVAEEAAEWFLRWIHGKTRAQADDILDVETGGMLEAWVELYALTRDEHYLPLIEFYRRPRIFDALERDPLTMMHANTTIPEALGYARAYEVLGDEKDLDTVKAYWRVAMDERGAFVTGGQTYNEVWTPMHQQAAYLGRDNQEHCVMYNLLRLADFLWRHTGEARYLDYMERAYVNGILAQQHPDTGMVAYYLPMTTGAKAKWGRKTEDFWCCLGTLVQIHEC